MYEYIYFYVDIDVEMKREEKMCLSTRMDSSVYRSVCEDVCQRGVWLLECGYWSVVIGVWLLECGY